MKPLIVVVGLMVAVFCGIRIGAWRQYVNDRSWKAELTFEYLAAPVVKEPNGRILSRAEALDMLIRGSVK